MSKNEKSGQRVTKIAAAILRDPSASKTARSLAGSTVAQAHTDKQSSAATARIAAKALNDGRTSAATRAMAGTVLTQKTKKS